LQLIAVLINNIGLLHNKMGKNDLALKLFQESIRENAQCDAFVAKSLLSIGCISFLLFNNKTDFIFQLFISNLNK
jgi:hypothetical protein